MWFLIWLILSICDLLFLINYISTWLLFINSYYFLGVKFKKWNHDDILLLLAQKTFPSNSMKFLLILQKGHNMFWVFEWMAEGMQTSLIHSPMLVLLKNCEGLIKAPQPAHFVSSHRLRHVPISDRSFINKFSASMVQIDNWSGVGDYGLRVNWVPNNFLKYGTTNFDGNGQNKIFIACWCVDFLKKTTEMEKDHRDGKRQQRWWIWCVLKAELFLRFIEWRPEFLFLRWDDRTYLVFLRIWSDCCCPGCFL